MAFLASIGAINVKADHTKQKVQDFINLSIDEKSYWRMSSDEQKIVAMDSAYFRSAEVDTLPGDVTNAKEKLGWVPRTKCDELVVEMVRGDLKAGERDELIKDPGYKAMGYHE